MVKSGEAAWLQVAARLGAGLPGGDERRKTLTARCESEALSERLVSRMISARTYALEWISEGDIKASHKTVEMLRTLENISPAEAANIRKDVLSGIIKRPQLTLMLEDVKLKIQSQRVKKNAMDLKQIIEQCRNDLSSMKFEWIEPPTGDEGAMLGADAEYSYNSAVEDEHGVPRRTYEPRWALVISPNISSSRIYGSGMRGFVLSVMALSWCYPNVSAFCSSQYEEKELHRLIGGFGGDLLRKKIITHLPST